MDFEYLFTCFTHSNSHTLKPRSQDGLVPEMWITLNLHWTRPLLLEALVLFSHHYCRTQEKQTTSR